MIRWLALACLLAIGCTQEVQLGTDDPLVGLVGITVAPGDTTIQIADLSAPPASIEYTATGQFSDGSTRDVTALVAWRVDNPAPGNFVSGGHYQTSQRAGGHVSVNAIAGPIQGMSPLHVVVTTTIIDGTFPPPPDVAGLFGSGLPIATGDPKSPAILYPSDGTYFPQGLARIVFQHRVGPATDAYRLTFESDVLHLTIYTSADRWQPDRDGWFLIAASHPGTSTIYAVDAASSTAPGTIYAGPPETLRFARADPGGSLTYWSASTNGIMRTELGAETATSLYAPTGGAMCIGCHTIARDGTQLAAGYGGETLQTATLPSLDTVISAATDKLPMGWASFSPDGTLLVVADKGNLVLRDAQTGMPRGTPDGRIALPAKATHPDWAPDGSSIVVALSGSITNMEIKNGSIARVPFHDGAFGAAEILVDAGAGMDNNYFPRWSPDGQFIAYVNAQGTSHGAPSAELRLVRATGGPPISLRAASHHVAALDVPDLASSMPSWGPSTGDVAWLSFASKRPYGAVMPMAAQGQIWIAAIDLARAGDPSYAAFWLPSQDVHVLDNNPIWTIAPTPAPQ
jgi:WD40 repeat protein